MNFNKLLGPDPTYIITINFYIFNTRRLCGDYWIYLFCWSFPMKDYKTYSNYENSYAYSHKPLFLPKLHIKFNIYLCKYNIKWKKQWIFVKKSTSIFYEIVTHCDNSKT